MKWCRCRNCGVWHRGGGGFCERCLRSGRTEETVRVAKLRTPRWWR